MARCVCGKMTRCALAISTNKSYRLDGDKPLSKLRFTTFQEVARLSAGRQVVLFGAGNIAAKTARKIGSVFSMILDNNPNLDGTEQLGVKVLSADALKTVTVPFVIICTTSFIEVASQLEGMGYSAERDFIVSPVLNDLRVIADLEAHEATLLFTSGLPPINHPQWGGGIYELKLGEEWSYRKIRSGNCHGLLKHGENIIAIDDALGIIEMDGEYQIFRAKELPCNVRAHGVAHSDITGCFYVACSYADKVLVLDPNFNVVDEFKLSHKHDRHGEPFHHCNDVYVIGTSLYVSMFSFTGNWKNNVFDGVVLEIDLLTGEKIGPVVQDLWMPHNVLSVDGSLVVLDSLRGKLLKNNVQSIGEFPAFTRGLAYDGVYFYIGQSRNRNYSSYLGVSKNISIDTAIIIFDEHTKVSRSLQLPSRLSEIHAIVAI